MKKVSGSGCFKVGCFSCLGCFGLLLLAVVGMSVLAALGNKEPRMETYRSSSTSSSALHAAPVVPGGTGTVRLDVSLCHFRMEPGRPGEGFALRGDYDAARMSVEESFEGDVETGWTYEVKILSRTFGFVNASDDSCSITLAVPPDWPFRLEGSVGIGETRIDLGGTAVASVDLSTGIGEHSLLFGEPTARPLEFVTMTGSIGEMRLERLGNASPAKVEVRHRIGETTTDLRGPWRNDSHVEIRGGVGAAILRAPREAGIVLDGGGVTIGESELEELWSRHTRDGMPTLTLSVSQRVGEVSID